MDNPEITITIAGRLNSGKSTIALAVAQALVSAGLRVAVVDEPLNEGWNARQNMRLAELGRKDVKVLVKTVNINRSAT